MSASHAGSILKVVGNVPDLALLAGDFLLLKPDGTPLCVIRKLDTDAAETLTERFGLEIALHTMDATTGPAEPCAIDLLRGALGE